MHDFFCTDSSKMYYPFGQSSMVLQRKREGSGNYVQSYGKMRDETAAEQNIKTLLVSVKNLMKT